MIPTIVSDALNSFLGYGLAIETSCRIGSVAIGCGGRLLEERRFSGPRKHASEFIATIDTLCRDHDVSPEKIREVYVSYGPGSFAGLRIGVTAARMIALAHGASVIATPTLDVIAQNALWLTPRPERVAVMLDAKRKRVYAAGFDFTGDSYVALSTAVEVDPATFLADQPPTCLVMGEGVEAYPTVVEDSSLRVAAGCDLPPGMTSLHTPRAGVVYHLGYALSRAGKTVSPRELIPLYIRPPEAEEQWAARHGA